MLDPVEEGGKESSGMVGGWVGQLLQETCVFGVWCGARVKHDLAKIQSPWPGLIIRKVNTCLCV